MCVCVCVCVYVCMDVCTRAFVFVSLNLRIPSKTSFLSAPPHV